MPSALSAALAASAGANPVNQEIDAESQDKSVKVDASTSTCQHESQPIDKRAASNKLLRSKSLLSSFSGRATESWNVSHSQGLRLLLTKSTSMPRSIPGRDYSLSKDESNDLPTEDQDNTNQTDSSSVSPSATVSEPTTSCASSTSSHPNVFIPPRDLQKNSETKPSTPESLTSALQRCATLPFAKHTIVGFSPEVSQLVKQFAVLSPFSSKNGSPSTPVSPTWDPYKTQPWR